MQIIIEVSPEGGITVTPEGAEPVPVQSMQELTEMLAGMVPELAQSTETAMWDEEVKAAAPSMDEMDQASITA